MMNNTRTYDQLPLSVVNQLSKFSTNCSPFSTTDHRAIKRRPLHKNISRRRGPTRNISVHSASKMCN